MSSHLVPTRCPRASMLCQGLLATGVGLFVMRRHRLCFQAVPGRGMGVAGGVGGVLVCGVQPRGSAVIVGRSWQPLPRAPSPTKYGSQPRR